MSCRHRPSILALAATLALGLVRVLLPALILAISLTARPATAWSIPDGAAAPSNDPPQASASLVSHEEPLTHRLSQWPEIGRAHV